MSLFAGFFSVADPSPTRADSALARAIASSISRRGDAPETVTADGFFLAKLDLGAHRGAALLREDDGSIAAICGEPLIDHAGTAIRPREESTCLLAADSDLLRRCRGIFTFCRFDAQKRELLLASDRLGARPLYYAVADGVVYFSSALRVLEELSAVPKRLDPKAFAETLAIGFPLADRTPYADVRILEGGEILTVSRLRGVERQSYFAWDRIDRTELDDTELIDEAHRRFITAIDIRSRGREDVFVPLSGGLDSRCVAFALRSLGKRLRTVSYETAGFVDGDYGTRIAAVLGSDHKRLQVPANEEIIDSLPRLRDLEWSDGVRPNRLFSGDGGSVGVGFVYVDPEPIAQMRAGQLADVARGLKRKLPLRFFEAGPGAELDRLLFVGVRDELARSDSGDPGRDLHLFFMNNDQRRHLHGFFERMDLHRFEISAPFMDPDFLELLIGAEADVFCGHAFYHRWLARFPDEFRAVPWQTYPGHVPCPVEEPTSGRRQWNVARNEAFATAGPVARRCRRIVSGKRFPAIMKRGQVMLALATHALRMQNLGYVFRACVRLEKQLTRCDGRIQWPGA